MAPNAVGHGNAKLLAEQVNLVAAVAKSFDGAKEHSLGATSQFETIMGYGNFHWQGPSAARTMDAAPGVNCGYANAEKITVRSVNHPCFAHLLRANPTLHGEKLR